VSKFDRAEIRPRAEQLDLVLRRRQQLHHGVELRLERRELAGEDSWLASSRKHGVLRESAAAQHVRYPRVERLGDPARLLVVGRTGGDRYLEDPLEEVPIRLVLALP
jgi:hypothetical protein